MRAPQYTGGSGPSVAAAAPDREPTPAHARVSSPNAPDGLESLLAALGERIARLEADVRNLQSRNANRA